MQPFTDDRGEITVIGVFLTAFVCMGLAGLFMFFLHYAGLIIGGAFFLVMVYAIVAGIYGTIRAWWTGEDE